MRLTKTDSVISLFHKAYTESNQPNSLPHIHSRMREYILENVFVLNRIDVYYIQSF